MAITQWTLILATAAALLAAPAAAQTPPPANCGSELNYDDADIRAVIDEIAVRTGRTFLLDPRINGRVTIKSPPNGTICPDEAWELFQAMLRVNGFAATPIGGRKFKIVPVQDAPRSAGPVGGGVGGDLVTEIVRLRHADAREAAANLSQIVNDRGVAAPVRSGNAIILVDTADNLVRLKQVLAQIDRDPTVYRTIALMNASALDVARVVSGLAKEMADEGGGRAVPITVLPVEASNSILIRAEPTMINRLSSVIAELDRMGATKADLAVVTLDHADAEDLAPLLRELAGAPTQTGVAGADGQASAPGRARAVITAHKPTNSIIISGDADIQATLKDVIARLDRRRAQVLVEAIIVEISDTTAKELGVQYFLGNTEGNRVPFSATDFSSAAPDIFRSVGQSIVDGGSASDPQQLLRDAALRSLLGVSGFGLGLGGSTRDGTIFGAILTAIKQDSTSNVLSTPSVVTLDNQEAKLSVGQEIPITTGERVGDNFQNAFRTVSREQVGIILEVTPQINAGGTVTLKLRQESSSVDGPVISNSTDLITNKREISTTAIVDDGDILVIGGLVDENKTVREEKVPFFGDVPVAGNLFKSRGKQRDRRNLMVFIRPTVLRDRDASGQATTKKLDYLRARELLSTGSAQSDLDRLIDQVTGIGAPAVPPDRNR